MKRLLSWLLALVMIISCLPLSALPAFAIENDVETEDGNDNFVAEFDELTKGMESNPIDLTQNLIYEGDFSATVTVPAGKTLFYKASRVAGMNMTINDGEAVVCTGDDRTPYVWSIKNDTDADAEYVIKVGYDVGHEMNPEVVEYLGGDVSVAEGNKSFYYYNYTAPEDGTVVVYITSITEGVTGNIVIDNLNTYEQKNLIADGVDNNGLELTVEVSKGDELKIRVLAEPDAEYNYPAADISWQGTFSAVPGSVNNPFAVEWNWNEDYTDATATVTVPAGATVYYEAVNNMMLTINDGEPYFMAGSRWNPAAPFSITNSGENDAEYALHIFYPVGSDQNPDKLNIGSNSAVIDAGAGEYYYNWTAEEDGTLTITMPSDMGWQYTISNKTTGSYGDTQWSDSDPVVNPAVVEVAKGDVIEVKVITYDEASPWAPPAGTLTFTAAFEAAEPIVKFGWAGMSVELKDSLAAKFVFPNASIVGEDNYAVIAKEVYDKTTGEITIENITIPQSEWVSYSATLDAIVFNGVAAMQMMDEFTVTIYNAKGQQISESYVRTIADYLYGRLGANIAQTMKNLAVDFLNYGSACQSLFSYRSTELANSALTDTQKSWATSDDAVSGIVSEQVKGSCFAGFTVAAEYEIVPSFVYVNSKISEVTYANVSYTDFQGNAVNYDIQASDFEGYSATMTKVVISGTAVPDGASPITVTLYKADGTAVDQSVDCVSFYAVRQISKHEAYSALLKLIYSAGIAF